MSSMMSCKVWHEKVPVTKCPLGTVFFVINIFFPGFGTMLASCINTTPGKLCPLTLMLGMAQMMTSWMLVGWIWSIYWGWLIHKKQPC